MKTALFVVVKSILYLISFLPFKIIYIISDILYVLLYHVFGYRKKVVFENLRKSFPERSEAELEKVAKGFYHFLCDQILESVKMLTISEETVKKDLGLTTLRKFISISTIRNR